MGLPRHASLRGLCFTAWRFESSLRHVPSTVGFRINGSMPEWLMGADCKSAGLPTLVQIQFGPIYLFLTVAVVEW